MTLEEFEAEYDFKRPKISGEEKTIVLTCQTGLQASQAAHQLLKSGYVKLAVHQGDTLYLFSYIYMAILVRQFGNLLRGIVC